MFYCKHSNDADQTAMLYKTSLKWDIYRWMKVYTGIKHYRGT